MKTPVQFIFLLVLIFAISTASAGFHNNKKKKTDKTAKTDPKANLIASKKTAFIAKTGTKSTLPKKNIYTVKVTPKADKKPKAVQKKGYTMATGGIKSAKSYAEIIGNKINTFAAKLGVPLAVKKAPKINRKTIQKNSHQASHKQVNKTSSGSGGIHKNVPKKNYFGASMFSGTKHVSKIKTSPTTKLGVPLAVKKAPEINRKTIHKNNHQASHKQVNKTSSGIHKNVPKKNYFGAGMFSGTKHVRKMTHKQASKSSHQATHKQVSKSSYGSGGVTENMPKKNYFGFGMFSGSKHVSNMTHKQASKSSHQATHKQVSKSSFGSGGVTENMPKKNYFGFGMFSGSKHVSKMTHKQVSKSSHQATHKQVSKISYHS
ncbi:MAG: hypothetical protein SGCHY_000499 [Lobulomycetales sp.]